MSGCDAAIDRDQARLCRIALVALGPAADTLVIRAERSVEPSAAAAESPFAAESAVRIEATRVDPRGRTQPTFAVCSFGGRAQRLLLAGVVSPAGTLPLPRLFVLNRYWVATPEAEAGDPSPLGQGRAAPRLPQGSGYALQALVNAVPGCAVYALLAVAYALIYGLIGRINLAFGAFGAIGGTAAVTAISLCRGTAPLFVTLLVAVGAAMVPAAVTGLASARLVFRPLRQATGQQVLVATIGLALVISETLRLTGGADPRWIAPLFNTPIALARDPGFVVTTTPIALLSSAAASCAVGGLVVALRRSDFGRRWRALCDDPGAAALFGVAPDAMLAQTFTLACAFAGLAGGITAMVYGDMTITYAQTIGLKALIAAILGGIGSVPGAALGGVFVGLVESGWSAVFPIVDRDLVLFCVLVATLIWRPCGFLGDRTLSPRRI